MKTFKMYRGAICTPKELEPFEKKEIEKIILRFNTGVYTLDVVCYPAYTIAEKTDEVLNDIKTL